MESHRPETATIQSRFETVFELRSDFGNYVHIETAAAFALVASENDLHDFIKQFTELITTHENGFYNKLTPEQTKQIEATARNSLLLQAQSIQSRNWDGEWLKEMGIDNEAVAARLKLWQDYTQCPDHSKKTTLKQIEVSTNQDFV